jgi:hypothetical protein
VNPGQSGRGAAGPYFPGLVELGHGARAVALQVLSEPPAVGAAELDLLRLVHHRHGPAGCRPRTARSLPRKASTFAALVQFAL